MSKKKQSRRQGRPESDLPSVDGQLTTAGMIAKAIRVARGKSGKSAEQCAYVAGMSVSRWYDFESGRAGDSPSIRSLWKVEAALGMPTNSLVKIAAKTAV